MRERTQKQLKKDFLKERKKEVKINKHYSKGGFIVYETDSVYYIHNMGM